MVLPYLAGNCEKKIIRAKRTRAVSWAFGRQYVLGTSVTKNNTNCVIPKLSHSRGIVKGSRRYREGSMG